MMTQSSLGGQSHYWSTLSCSKKPTSCPVTFFYLLMRAALTKMVSVASVFVHLCIMLFVLLYWGERQYAVLRKVNATCTHTTRQYNRVEHTLYILGDIELGKLWEDKVWLVNIGLYFLNRCLYASTMRSTSWWTRCSRSRHNRGSLRPPETVFCQRWRCWRRRGSSQRRPSCPRWSYTDAVTMS